MVRAMAEERPIAVKDVHKALAKVQGLPSREALAALALDVVSRQAEGKTLFAGKEFVDSRAAEHGLVDASDESVSSTLAILGRGPSSPRDRALVGALAVDGLGRAIDAGDEDVALRFVRHAAWLELSMPYVVFPFVDGLLSDEAAGTLYGAVADAVLADDSEDSAARARSAGRVTALVAAGAPAGEALARIGEQAKDSMVRAMAGGGEAAPDDELRLEGRVAPAPKTGLWGVVHLVSGWALLVWLARTLGMLVGLVREAEVRFVDGGLRIKRSVKLFGRVVREAEETWTLSAVAGAGRTVRYPALHLLVGAISLSAGLLLGVLLLFDGAQSGETVLLLLAAVAIIVGGGLDLALSTLLPGRRGQVAVELHLLSVRGVRILRVPLEEADRFLAALDAKLPR